MCFLCRCCMSSKCKARIKSLLLEVCCGVAVVSFLPGRDVTSGSIARSSVAVLQAYMFGDCVMGWRAGMGWWHLRIHDRRSAIAAGYQGAAATDTFAFRLDLSRPNGGFGRHPLAFDGTLS